MRLGVAMADAPWEKHKAISDTPVFDGDGYEIEDPFIWYADGKYHLMAKDMNGNICGEFMSGVHATSDDGKNWNFDIGKLFYSRNIELEDGTNFELGNMERPSILFEDGKPICAYFAVSDGKDGGGFHNCTRTWCMPVKFREEL